jgi:hypothetical protein
VSASAFFTAACLTTALVSQAGAQQSLGVIEQRIESTFDLVIGNTPELAIPLTRRALARRSKEDNSVDALAYHDDTGTDPPALDEGSATVDQAVVEQDIEVARLPRPRPDVSEGDADEPAASDAPLDLVAGAAEQQPDTPVAAAEPQPPPTNAKNQPIPPAAATDQPILPVAATQPAPELVATGACLSPKDVVDKDGDFKRNADALSGNAFCITEETFKERRRNWTIQTVKTNRPGPLWAVMHDDEDMSFDNAVAALKAYGGTLVAVDTGGRRNMDGIDPNRNFSADGIGCSKLGTDAAPRYTAFFRNLMSDEPIIALHNNVDGPVPTGGIGHASMESVPKDMDAFPAPDQKGELAGERNLVLLASIIPVTATSKSRAAALNAKGMNVMIEGIRDGSGDCSLSNYALLTGHPDYLNVTVDHDERDRQRKIIDVIMAGRNDTVATQ